MNYLKSKNFKHRKTFDLKRDLLMVWFFSFQPKASSDSISSFDSNKNTVQGTFEDLSEEEKTRALLQFLQYHQQHEQENETRFVFSNPVVICWQASRSNTQL